MYYTTFSSHSLMRFLPSGICCPSPQTRSFHSGPPGLWRGALGHRKSTGQCQRYISYHVIYIYSIHTHRDRWMDTQIGLQVHGQTYIDVLRFVGCKGRYSAYIQRHACRSMYLQSADEITQTLHPEGTPRGPKPCTWEKESKIWTPKPCAPWYFSDLVGGKSSQKAASLW